MNNTGYNNTTLKQQNRGLLFKMILTEQCNSRVELAQQTGLSKMAVTNIVREFEDLHYIEEHKSTPLSGKGRNPVRLVVSDRAPKLIGINIVREGCTVLLCDLNLRQIRESKFDITEENKDELLPMLFRSVDEVTDGMPEGSLLGIGVGALGPIDRHRGLILNPPHFYGLRNIEIVKELKERYGLPVYLDGHYNCAAVLEKYFGAARECQDFLFVGVRRGIGSGFIHHEEIYRNNSGFTSEFGHVSIDWKGRLCSCGNRGCLEQYLSTGVLENELAAITGEPKTFREYGELYSEKAPDEVEAFFEERMNMLATAIVSVINYSHPEMVVIGDMGYWIPDRFITYLEQIVNEKKLGGSHMHVSVCKPHFKDRGRIIGSVCAVLEALFRGELF